MTVRSTIIFPVLVLTAITTGTLHAQPQRDEARAGQPGQDPLQEHLFPPELIMQHQNAIELGDDQRARLREEIAQAQGSFLELQWDLQDAMEELVGLVRRDGTTEDEVLAQLDQVLDAEREIKRAQLTLLLRIKNQLTPEQQERLRQIRRQAQPHDPAP